MPGNADYDSLLSTTLNNYRRTLEDNIFNTMPLLFWLKNRKKILDGGAKILVALLYGKNETVKSYAGYEALDVAPQEGITSAEFNWKQVAGSISISRIEERKNSGQSRIINLLESKIMQCEISLQDAITTMLFADGTGNDSKDILGLAAIVADAPSTGILGGIDRAGTGNSWWQNYSVAGTKTTTAFDTLQAKMRTAYNTVSKGNDHPDLAIADQASYEGYESTLVAQKRFSDTKMADAGFENLKFKGSVVTFDDACPNTTLLGRMYFLNSKYLQWTVDAQTDFLTTPFVRPDNQDAKTAQILLYANLVISNCARQGVIYDIDLA